MVDERRFVEYCVRRAESLAVGESPLAIRTKILPGRLQDILSELIRQERVLSLAAKLYIHRDTAAEVEQRRDRRARADLVDDDEDRRSGDPGCPWHERDVDLHGRMSLLRAGAGPSNAL